MTAPRRRVVVVGNGMAGFRFSSELVQRDESRRFAVSVVSAEPGGAYNRVLLSNLLAKRSAAADLVLSDEAWYTDHGVALHGVAAVSIDRIARQVDLADGRSLAYDVLVLATGSTPLIPALHGPGVVPFRTLADCRRIDELAASARAAVVLGGGVLGVEAAVGLADRGLAVTLVQRGSRLMDRQLDGPAAALLARILESRGVVVRSGTGLREVIGKDRTAGAVLDDGSHVAADLVVLSCGVRPDVALAREAGLAVRSGVIVDDHLRSVSDPAVIAIGECAEHRGATYGLVAPVWEQARIAAQALVAPEASATYEGSTIITRLKAAGIELASMGEPAVEIDDDDGDVICFRDNRRRVYQKLVVHDGRLTGAILLGDTRAAGTISQLYDRRAELPADRSSLLISRRNSPLSVAQSPTLLPGSTTICQCNGVTKSTICGAWEKGARRLQDVAARTRATTGCGTCKDTVQGLLDWMSASDPSALVSA